MSEKSGAGRAHDDASTPGRDAEGQDVSPEPERDDAGDSEQPDTGSAGTSRGARHGRTRKRGPIATFLRETTIVVVTALVLSFVIKTFLAQAFFIPSVSMQDTLQVGDRLVVNKLVPDVMDIQRGDVVVFLDPGGWLNTAPAAEPSAVQRVLIFIGIMPQHADEHVIKRVIGLGGDRVVCCDSEGRVTVNGAALDETYLAGGVSPSDTTFDVVVPDEHLWVLGDNRSNSGDSRYHGGAAGGGFIPESNVVGRAFVIVWPADRITWMSRPDQVFAGVPDAS